MEKKPKNTEGEAHVVAPTRGGEKLSQQQILIWISSVTFSFAHTDLLNKTLAAVCVHARARPGRLRWVAMFGNKQIKCETFSSGSVLCPAPLLALA